jgi:hypothetical protein
VFFILDRAAASQQLYPVFERAVCIDLCEGCMKLRFSLISLLGILSLAATPGLGQVCTFPITGDWELKAPGKVNSNLYRFGSNGIVTVFSSAGQKPELGRAAYKLDNAQAPKTIEFKSIQGTGLFPSGATPIKIAHSPNTGFMLVNAGSEPSTWSKRDRYQYFVVLAAHHGTPPHKGGPAFGMLLKSDGDKTEIETFGLHYQENQRIHGPVPEELYRQFMAGPLTEEDAMLRLQITPEEFARSMNIVRNWQRRAREGALLFPQYSYLNVIVPLKEIAESLNQCGETIKLHKLTWLVDDELGANVPQWELAFAYVKKLRQLNDALHITDDIFRQRISSHVVHSQLSAK